MLPYNTRRLSCQDFKLSTTLSLIGTLSERGRQRQRRKARKIFLPNPRILLSIPLLWLPCVFLFSLKLL